MAQSSYTSPDHTRAEKAPPAPEPGHMLLRDIISMMEAMVAHVPTLHAMGPRLAAMHARLDDMISLTDKK